MKLERIALAAILAATGAANAAVSVVTFDDIPEGTITSNQYNGVVITGASVLTIDSSLNPVYPPLSNPNVVYDYLDGTIRLDFTTAVASVGGYITSGIDLITLSAFDGATLLGTVTLPALNIVGAGTGVDPNYFLNLTFAHITSATFSNTVGFGNTFTLDNLTVGGTVTVVPEPASYALMFAGLGAIGLLAKRRQA